MIWYQGSRESSGRLRVYKFSDHKITCEILPGPSQTLRNHSPTGFEWGYGGSGPAQLALALLLDVIDNEEDAMRFYMAFKWAKVSKFPQRGFVIGREEIYAWCAARPKAGGVDDEDCPWPSPRSPEDEIIDAAEAIARAHGGDDPDAAPLEGTS